MCVSMRARAFAATPCELGLQCEQEIRRGRHLEAPLGEEGDGGVSKVAG